MDNMDKYFNGAMMDNIELSAHTAMLSIEIETKLFIDPPPLPQF